MRKKQTRPVQKLFHIKEIQRMKASCEICRTICGSTRFKIIALLKAYQKGLSVTELASMLRASLSRISHQLRILRAYKLVVNTSQNRKKIYRLEHKLANLHLP